MICLNCLRFNVHFPFRKITKQNNFESNYQEKTAVNYPLSKTGVLCLCCPRWAETSLQAAKLATKQKPFHFSQLGRVRGNTDMCQGQTAKMRKCFINITE
jgi:hypothetical protein